MIYSELLSYTEDVGKIYAQYYKALAYSNVANESETYYSLANEGVIDAIKSFFSRLWEFIKNILSKVWNFIKAVFSKFISLFKKKTEQVNQQNDAKEKIIESQKKLVESISGNKVDLSKAKQAADETAKAVDELHKTAEETNNRIQERHESFQKQMDNIIAKIKASTEETSNTHEKNQKEIKELQKKLENSIENLDKTYAIELFKDPSKVIKSSYGLRFDNSWKENAKNVSYRIAKVLKDIYDDQGDNKSENLRTFTGWFKEVAIHQTVGKIMDPPRWLFDALDHATVKEFKDFKEYNAYNKKFLKAAVSSLENIYKVINDNLNSLKPFESLKLVEDEVNRILNAKDEVYSGTVNNAIKRNIPLSVISKFYSIMVQCYIQCNKIALSGYRQVHSLILKYDKKFSSLEEANSNLSSIKEDAKREHEAYKDLGHKVVKKYESMCN